MMQAIINGRLVLSNKILDGGALLFDKKIIGVVSRETLDAAWKNERAWKGESLVLTDAQGAYVSPGFINLHIHGCAGADTMDDKEDALAMMSDFLVKTGVTSFLPTTMTYDLPTVYKALERIRESMTVMIRRREEQHKAANALQFDDSQPVHTKRLRGAKALGAYLEGPFISGAYKGAQKKEYISVADFKKIESFADVIKVVVLAPETLPSESLNEFIAQCRAHNIIVSLGHSAAGYDEAMQAVKAGASHVTHLCNAMTGLHHRNPGLLGAALDSGVTCELIADDLHVHPAVQRLLYHCKSAAELELITDSMRACGLPAGVSELGGQTVYVKNGAARLKDETLAGSIVTMNQAMANFSRNTGASVPEVVRMVTENQAQELGLFEKIGSLSPGAAADIAIFNENFTVYRTFVDGQEVYRNSEFG